MTDKWYEVKNLGAYVGWRTMAGRHVHLVGKHCADYRSGIVLALCGRNVSGGSAVGAGWDPTCPKCLERANERGYSTEYRR